MKRRTPLLLLFSILVLAQTVLAADLQFEGVPTFTVARSKVNLVVPKIINKSQTISGPVIVQVWATETPYTGQNFSGGYILATKTLAALKPNAAYSNLVLALPLKIPANGEYFTLVAIHETKPNTQPVDYVNSPDKFNFINAAQISMEGDATWTLTSSGAIVKMTAAKIANNAYAGRSGTLQLELWATPAPYDGGRPQNGFMLGSGLLSALNAGYSLSNITKVASLRSPPGGFYYTTLIVTEYTRTGYIPRDYVNVPGTFYFGGPTANAPKLDLDGTMAWAILGKTVKITLGKIVNPRNGSASGALKAYLYSTPSPYTGGPLPAEAQLLATATFGAIKGSVTLSNLSRTVAFTQPVLQTNYTTVKLVEMISPTNSVEQDYYAFVSQVIITNKQLAGLSENPPPKFPFMDSVDISGKASFTITKDTLNLNLEKISNYQLFHTNTISGPLLVRVWAVPPGTNVLALTMADRYIGQLQKTASFTGISGPIPYTKPPPGKYRATIWLYEFGPYKDANGVTQIGWVYQDRVDFNGNFIVR